MSTPLDDTVKLIAQLQARHQSLARLDAPDEITAPVLLDFLDELRIKAFKICATDCQDRGLLKRRYTYWSMIVQKVSDYQETVRFQRIPTAFHQATRAGARDLEAYDLVMAPMGGYLGRISYGPTGTGKTTAEFVSMIHKQILGSVYITHVAAVELARMVGQSGYDRRNFGEIISCLEGSDPIEEDSPARNRSGKNSSDRYSEIGERWGSADGLLIDDISVPKFTPKYAETLYGIVNARVENESGLYITSQVDGDTLLRKWKRESPDLDAVADAILRRIGEYCKPVRFEKGSPLAPSPHPPALDGLPRAETPAAPSDASCVNVEPKPNQEETDHENQNRQEAVPRPVIAPGGRDCNPGGADLHPGEDRALHEPQGGGIVHSPPLGPLF